MAFRSNGPVVVALPPFRGVTRRIVLIALVTFFASLVLGLIAPGTLPTVTGHLALIPAAFLHNPWQVLTYAFLPMGLLSTIFALLSMWIFGALLEEELGSRWLAEYFLVTTIGGGLLAIAIASTRVLGLSPDQGTVGLWPATMAVLLAFARLHPEEPLRFNFILTLKAKYLAAIYLLFYLALSLIGGDRLGAVTALCASLSGYLYLRFAPRRGLQFATSEGFFGIRNAYYRAKRRRAAKKFTVYMRKQGKDVNIDASGRYIGLDDERKDPNDKRWMN